MFGTTKAKKEYRARRLEKLEVLKRSMARAKTPELRKKRSAQITMLKREVGLSKKFRRK